MKDQFVIPKIFKVVSVILIIIGAAAFISGLIINPELTWANYLIVNYYF